MTWITLACIAAFFKAMGTITEKEVLFNKSVHDYISGGSLLVAVFSLPLLYFVKDMSLESDSIVLIFLLSLLSVVSAISLGYVVKKIDISESSSLMSVTPIIVALFGAVFIGELLSTMQVIGILISSIGLFVLEINFKKGKNNRIELNENADIEKIKNNKDRLKMYFILLIGLVGFGFSAIGDRYAIHYVGIDPLLFLVIVQLFIVLNMFVFDIIRDVLFGKTNARNKLLDADLFSKKAFWANIVFIMAHRITHMFAINLVAAGLLNAVKQINVVFVTVLGGKLFKEDHLWKKTIACLIIVGGVLMVIV